jgi:PqqD family protein of HPr-rel-A system
VTTDVGPSWRAGRADELVWAQFGTDFVLYHRRSGKTHFLNAATAVLLKEVLIQPKSSLEAAQELADRQTAVASQDFLAAVQHSLEHLEYLGLVERM